MDQQTAAAVDFVYLIRDGDIHKIGMSKDPETRMLFVASNESVLVHVIPSSNPYQIEHALHRRFAHAHSKVRRGREWFSLSAEDIEAICRLGRVDTVDDLPEELAPGPKVRSGVPLHIYIPPELRDALDGAADANRRKVTQEVIMALEEHLKRQGRWPPPQEN